MLSQICFFVSIAFSPLRGESSPPDTSGRNYACDDRPKPYGLCSSCKLPLHRAGIPVPGVVSPALPSAFAHSAAYGDIVAGGTRVGLSAIAAT